MLRGMRICFPRHNITDERDLHEAGEKMNACLQKQPRKTKVVTAELTERTDVRPEIASNFF
jgi:hypothetical protein